MPVNQKENPQRIYFSRLASELTRIASLSKDQQQTAVDSFYTHLHGLDQPLSYGHARTRAAGLMDLEAVVGILYENAPDNIAEIMDVVNQLRKRSEQDPRLSGLGTQPHEEY